jgi:uncharacterized protein (DUF488 family)
MIKLFTIGFTNKTAEKFFDLLINSDVTNIIDIRINNVSQLAGFAKESDLKYFAKKIGNISYEHNISFAPTKELLSSYRKKEIDWNKYEKEYIKLLDNRNIVEKMDIEKLDNSCLLCSEHLPDKCHRRLLAEYLNQKIGDIKIVHLK